MKALFTAAGSIGSRHIKNLSKICQDRGIPLEIDVIRTTERVLPSDVRELVRKEIRNDINLDDMYDVLFVTDETGKHYDSICKYEKVAKNFFIEKPIFENTGYDISSIIEKNPNRIFYVAAPIRFTKYYDNIRKIAKENKILSARVIFSDYMPGWQKGRDYKESFRCFKSRGGGVDADSIHEIDYVVDLFGFPQKAYGMRGHFSQLKMDSCDIASYMFEYEDKIVEIHLDYFGKKRNRSIELYTDDEVVFIDFDKSEVNLKSSGKVINFGPDKCFYENEMEYFLDLISGQKENVNSVGKALKVLELAKTC